MVLREAKEEPEGIPVGGHGRRRDVALLDQALGKEALHDRCERGTGEEGRTHDRPSASPATKRA